MIAVQTIVDRAVASLDAEGSDRYTFERDFKPAINSSVEWIVAVFNAAFADKKLSEENLEELIKVRIWQASAFSRIHFDEPTVGDDRWSILKVALEPVVHPEEAPPALPSPVDSIYRNDLSFISSPVPSAKRLTMEQWDEKDDNIFSAGNGAFKNQLRSYAYLNPTDYRSTGYAAKGAEIEISPSVAEQFVAIAYIKYPTQISLITDNIEFPKVLIDMIFQKALNFISYKQGDQTNLYTVTQQDINTLAQLMV